MENSEKTGNQENKMIINPFPGLRPFTPEESNLFFGREGQSDEIMNKLIKNRFVTVIGSSGSGKSSLIYCGIIPRLINGDKNAEWLAISMRPGNDPYGNMVGSLAEAANKSDEQSLIKLESALRSGSQGLDSAIDILGVSGYFLIVYQAYRSN